MNLPHVDVPLPMCDDSAWGDVGGSHLLVVGGGGCSLVDDDDP